MELLIPAIEAEDELKQRAASSPLSPDRYKQLLLYVGVEESEAETARAQLELKMMSSRNRPQWQPK